MIKWTKCEISGEKKSKHCVVIPIHKQLDKLEKASLKQCLNVLKKWDICIVSPYEINISALNNNIRVLRPNPEYFQDIKGYNTLCKTKRFYKSFKEYEYVLIYQLDCWVFSDNLEEWCNKGYDYIGAPWFKKINEEGKDYFVKDGVGNGGFSLRKVQSFIDFLDSISYINKEINEDLFFSKHNKGKLKIPTEEEASLFSLEVGAQYWYEKNDKKLPMGCHKWWMFNYNDFWKKYIKNSNSMKTLVCGIGRNENQYIREWVEHYKNLGFTNICLYDNNRDGEEHFEEVIGDYIDNGFVILKDYRNKQKCQNIAYQECYNEYGKDYDWIVFFDIDEFLEIKNYKTISEYLSYVSQFNPDMIHLNWMIYGDENKPIDYNKNIGYGFPENNHIKTIVKTGKNIDWIRSSNPHAPFSQGLKCVNNKGDICDANSPFNPYDYTEAYLKHYSTKTAKEYARKMKRGFPDQMWDGSRIKNLVETRFFRTNEVTQEKVDIFKEELGLDFSYLLKRTNMDKRKDVQIFNLCYSKKDYAFKEDSVITPLQVGAANGTDVCELKDNTGDNISAGNFFYIENTGTYWIWRNVKDAKYKGQFQYRRPLEGINEETDFEKIFSEYDVITCVPFNHPANSKPTKENPMCIPAKTVEGGYAFSNCLYDLLAMESVVKSMFPDYASDWDKYIKKGENLYYSSGFIMRAEDYDRYSEFLFRCFNGWLQKAEIQTPLDLYYHVGKNVGMGGYEMRYPNMSMPKEAIKWQSEIGGFIGERLWTLWLQHNFPQEKIYKVPYVKQEEGMYT